MHQYAVSSIFREQGDAPEPIEVDVEKLTIVREFFFIFMIKFVLYL